MKAIVEQRVLWELLRAARRVSYRVATVPTATHVQITLFPKGTITTTSTDFDVWLESRGTAISDQDFSVCVPTEPIANFIDKLPAGAQLSLSDEPNGLRLRCGRTTAMLGGLPPEEFPIYRNQETEKTVSLITSVSNLKESLGRVIHAVSKDTTKPSIMGVHLFRRDNKVIVEAMDTKGVARQTMLDLHQTDIPGIILPARSVGILLELLSHDDDPVTLTIDPGWFALSVGEHKFTTKLLGERFPDMDMNFPVELETTAEFDAVEMADALERIVMLATDKPRTLMLTVDPADNSIEIATRDRLIHQGGDAIAAIIKGPATKRALNGKNLLRFLSPIAARARLSFPPDDHRQRCNLLLEDLDNPGFSSVVGALYG